VSYGILPYRELAELRQPSMGGVLEAAVGDSGSVFVSVGLIVSVLGAYLAWTLMAAEVLFVAAKDDDMPRFLRRVNTVTDVPTAALLMSTALVQIMLVVTMFSEDAFNFALDLTSALTLIPLLLFAAGPKFILVSMIIYAPASVLVRDGAARTGQAVVLPGRACHPPHIRRRCGRRSRRPGGRLDHHLGVWT
jgi:amino acid transporter